MASYHGMSVKDMATLEGISDLKTALKVKFIRALQAESRGEHEMAAKLLDEAIALEANPLSGVKGA